MSFGRNLFSSSSRVTVISVSSAILIASTAFAGWIFHIEILKSFYSAWPALKFNTALAMICAGISLFLFIMDKKTDALILASIVLILGAVSLGEYLFNWNAHIDELVFIDRGIGAGKYPGRMAQFTTVALIITAISLLLYPARSKRIQNISSGLAIFLFIVSFAGIVGALYDAGQSFRAANIASFSIPTALSGMLMSVGILSSKPRTGLLAAFFSRTASAKAGIKGIIIVLTILVVIGWISLKASESGFFDKEMSMVVMIILFTVSFLFIVLPGIQRINEVERRLLTSEKNLRDTLSSTADVFYVIDRNYNITLINELAVRNLTKAWGKIVVQGANILEMIPNEKEEPIRESFEKVFAGERIEYELHELTIRDLPEWVLVSYKPVIAGNGIVTGAYVVTRDITEQKKAELALRESEKRYRSLIEQASDFIMITDTNGDFIDANSSFYKTFGYSADELLKLNINKVIDPEQLKTRPVRFDLLTSGQAVLNERRMIDRDGNIIDVEANVKMLPDGRILAIARDIRERKKIEGELREAEVKFRNLVEQSLVGVYIIQDGRFAYVNPRFAEIFGYDRDEMIRSFPLENVIEPDDRPMVSENVRARLSGEIDSIHYEANGQKKDGGIIRLEIFCSGTQYAAQPAIIGTLLDITERQKSQEALLASETTKRLIMDSALDAIISMNTAGVIIAWTPQAEKMFGWEEKEVIGKTIADTIIPEKYRERHKQGLEHYLRTGEGPVLSKIIEITALNREGIEFPVELSIIPVKQDHTEFFCAFIRDISERKKAETDLEQSFHSIRELTEHLQNIREEERIHIAREIHDELGQQLTVLKMDVSWLDKKIGEKDEAIKARIKELLMMLDQTVKSVRRISSELRPSLLDDVGLTAAMEWHVGEFEKRFEIKKRFLTSGDDSELSDAVKTALFRIFQESLTNVARHSKTKLVTVILDIGDDLIRLSVEDDGVGFDKRNAVGRKTLGILGMKERTAMIGGTYDIISEPGKGTIVSVAIPLARNDKS